MKLINIMLVAIGFVTLAIGIAGTVLPVLPSTPFFLITLGCFAKGSPRFNEWFCNTKIYNKYLKDFVHNRSMTLKTKICILSYATAMMAIAFITVPKWQIRAVLVVLCISAYTYFFTCIKTIPAKKQ